MLCISAWIAFFFFWGSQSGIGALLDQINIPRGGRLYNGSKALALCALGMAAATSAAMMIRWGG